MAPMRRPLALLASSLLVVALASAARGQPDEPATWVVRIAGREIGREVAAPVTSKDGRVVRSSRATLRVTDEPFVYTQTLVCDDAGGVASYALVSSVISVSLRPGADGALSVGGAIAGNTVDKPLPPAAGPRLVLDNLVFSHYDALGAEAVRRGGKAFEFQAIVPQVLTAVPGRYEARRTVRVLGPAGEVEAREAEVTLGNLLLTLVHDARTGEAYRVTADEQKLDALREGFAPPAGQGPPLGVPAEDPSSYQEHEVRFDAPLGPVPGTLTRPTRGSGPWPVVVLLHGSGPHDRHETIGPNGPLRDLARALAARGVASLRYDKRTFLLVNQLRAGGPGRAAAEEALRSLTFDGEAIDDAAAAVAFVASQQELRADRVVVAGHSQGALAASELAGRAGSGVAGLVVLAGAGRSFVELLEEQVGYQAGLQGKTKEEAAEQVARLAGPLRDGGAALSDAQMVLGASGRYWKDLLRRDPCATIATTRVPVLLLQGAADCQVKPLDQERLAAALAARPGAPPVEVHLLKGLNHLFMPVSGPSTGAEYATPNRVDPAVAERIARWIEALGR